ncbi:MAG: hypothetical protein EA401_01095 [Planctomycetota bacterium]|nr:MAG: hypothetical protein EA401_01095 [Planctomycetota bacterium]
MSDQYDDDAILRALRDGDTAMPDGRALARLGAVFREAAQPPRPPHLQQRVSQACAKDMAQLSDAVDAWYNGDRSAAVAADPLLQRLGTVVREGAALPRQPDLVPRIAERLQRSNSSRRHTVEMDSLSRWRIYTAVIVGHVAALIALAALHVTVGRGAAVADPIIAEQQLRERPGFHRIPPSRPSAGAQSLATRYDLPQSWAELRGGAHRLFALREDAATRAHARQALHGQSAAGVVQGGMAWLLAQQNADGSIGPAAPNPDAHIMVQAAVALALLGEGRDRPEFAAATQRLLGWLADSVDEHGGQLDVRAQSLALLALVEGSVHYRDNLLQGRCEQLLQRLGPTLMREPGAAGLGGFALLAVEIAGLAEMRVPSRVRSGLESGVARAVPPADADVGRLGLAAFVRQVRGAGNALSTAELLQAIAADPPRIDAQRLDLMAWYFPTLAMRETRDRRWQSWNEHLESALFARVQYSDDGSVWMPAAAMRYSEPFAAAGDTVATAMTMLLLQAPYRYLPLRG